MVDYKDTLNLPNTAFSMKANLAVREPERLARWESEGVYQMIRNSRKGAPSFILHDGPPYANGDIHIGHCVNKILKDMIIKSKTLSGFDAPYVPGWDCHGLPIEINVEKKFGRVGQKLNASEFRQACRDYALTQVDKQRVDFIRLGIFGDWHQPYLTMAPDYEANIVRALAKMIDKGHLQKGFKPVHWCTDCGSSLAEAEVEYQDKVSTAVHVAFPVTDMPALLKKVPALAAHDLTSVDFVIWTTTPWTLPSNEAVCLNPALQYDFIRYDGNRCIVIAHDLLEPCLAAYGITDVDVITTVLGSELEFCTVAHPWFDRSVPVILGDHVTTDAGTGAVHTAPGHGEDDYLVGMKYQLPVDHRVDSHGCFVGDTPIIAGQHISKSNEAIIEHLKAQGRLLHDSKITHSYPHCWRHKTPIIFRATPQWFLSMDQAGLRTQALAAIKTVKWVPDWGQARIQKMVETRPDWCISRQRTWTMPITSYIHRDSGDLHPDTQRIMATVAKAIEAQGMEAWYNMDDRALIGDDVDQYIKIKDGLDVWFDSGVSHAAVLDARADLHAPADIYLEGSDQHRGWFQSSLLTRVAMNGVAPYKQVLTHGYTVDQHGRKMSKSLGNVVPPEKVIKRLGVDILRLWVSASDYRNDMTVSDEMFDRMSDAYRRIRNTSRFLLANMNGFDPKKDKIALKDMVAMDRYIVRRAKALQVELMDHYNQYQFHLIYQKLHNFMTTELGSFYLDIIKDRQYTAKAGTKAHQSAQTAMYHLVQALVRWLAPIMPFTAEEIWEHIPAQTGSLFTATWYEGFNEDANDSVMNDEYWALMQTVRDEVNKALEAARKLELIGSGLDAKVTLYAKAPLFDALSALDDELRFLLITSAAEVKPFTTEAGLSATALPELFVNIDVNANTKCVRCWQRREDVGVDAAHPELCGRCVVNVAGAGELRFYA